MPTVEFAEALRRRLECPAQDVPGDTVRAALDAAFAVLPLVRGYVLDEHGALRKHMAIFVDGELLRDRVGLGDPVRPAGVIHVLQALSGG